MCLYCICTYDMYTCCKCGCREEDGISRNIKNPGFNIRPRLFLWDLQIQQFPVLLVVLLHDPLDHLAQGRLISKGFKGYNLDFKRFGSDFQIFSIKHRIQAHVEPETGNPRDRVKA